MAWVGIKRDSDQQIIVIASAGEHLDYLQNINISAYSGVSEGNGPTGVAYRENKIVTANQLTTDCKTKPWLKRI